MPPTSCRVVNSGSFFLNNTSLQELPKDKWFCCNDCDRIFVTLSNLVVRGSDDIPSSESIKINRKLLEKGLSEVSDVDIQWRILSGKCRHDEHLPLLSKAISIFRVRIFVALTFFFTLSSFHVDGACDNNKTMQIFALSHSHLCLKLHDTTV